MNFFKNSSTFLLNFCWLSPENYSKDNFRLFSGVLSSKIFRQFAQNCFKNSFRSIPRSSSKVQFETSYRNSSQNFERNYSSIHPALLTAVSMRISVNIFLEFLEKFFKRKSSRNSSKALMEFFQVLSRDSFMNSSKYCFRNCFRDLCSEISSGNFRKLESLGISRGIARNFLDNTFEEFLKNFFGIFCAISLSMLFFKYP